MGKGFLAGAVMGTAVSILGAGVVAVVVGPPERQPVTPEVTAGPTAPSVDEPDAPSGAAPGEDVAGIGETSPAPVPDALPETAPVATEAPPSPEDPEPVADEAPARIAPNAPATSRNEPDAPTAPALEPAPLAEAGDTPPEAVTELAPPVGPVAPDEAPTVGDVTLGEAPKRAETAAPGVAGPENAPVESTSDTPPQTVTDLDAPETPPAPETGIPDERIEMAAPDRPETMAPRAPASEATPELATATPEPPLPAQRAEEPDTGAPVEDAPATPEPGSDSAQETASARPTIGTPARSLLDRDSASSSRLPSIGDTSEDTEAAPEAGAQDKPPLERFAADVDVPADEPRMAIVLIDDGVGPLGPDTVGEFPFPVSFAISPSHPDPVAAARGYRAKGFEVLALAGAPEGAQASDVEVSLGGALDAVPEAVAVLEDPDMGLQASRAVSEQAAQILLASGHGLLMLPNGLNTGQALALREGVPSATVFRDFDGEGQDPRVMRRFLDQAAFKARQEGAVVMMGRLRADTVSALLLWGLQDRATSVAMVPISVVLRESVAGD